MMQRVLSAVSSGQFKLAMLGLVAVSLSACQHAPSPASGHLDIAFRAASEASCPEGSYPAWGSFDIRSLASGASMSLPGDELSVETVVRRELPAGLYGVSWSGLPVVESVDETSMLRGPALVNVFAGRVTTLRVRTEAAACGEVSPS
jgi:hypothetical protein